MLGAGTAVAPSAPWLSAGHPRRREPARLDLRSPGGGSGPARGGPGTPVGVRPEIAFAAYDGRDRVRVPSEHVRALAADPEPELPLIRRLAGAPVHRAPSWSPSTRWPSSLVVVATEVLMTPRTPRVSGTAWDAAGWVAYLVAAVATLFRRRAPRPALAVVVPIALAALGLRAGGPIVFLVALTLYSVVVVSAGAAGHAVTAVVAARCWPPPSPGAARRSPRPPSAAWRWSCSAGWPGRTPGRAGSTPGSAGRAGRRAGSAVAGRAGRAGQPGPGRRAGADRPGAARHRGPRHERHRGALGRGPHGHRLRPGRRPARPWPSSRPPPAGRCTRCGCWSGCCATPDDQPAELSPVPGLADLDRLIADTAAAGVAAEVDVDGEAPAAAAGRRACPPTASCRRR